MRSQFTIIALVALTAVFAGMVRSQEPVVPPVPQAQPLAPANMEQVVYGDPSCCARCATSCACQKRTRIVCEMKKVKKTSFVCECEDVCGLRPSSMLPDSLFGFSLFGSKKVGCGEVGCSDCAQGCCQKAPIAAHCRTRKILVEKTTTVEVPVYKCVVEFCCDGCGHSIDAAPEKAKGQADASEAETYRTARLPRDPSGYGE